MAGLDSIKPKLKNAFFLDVLSRLTVTSSASQTVDSGALYVETGKITTFPSFGQIGEPVAERQLTHAVGCAVWAALNSASKERWKKKLVSATEAEVAQLWPACESSEDYAGAVRSIKHAVPRLVAIHISNAMISARVPFTQAVRNRNHPCAEGIRTGAVQYSLIPLLSAYAPSLVSYIPPEHVCVDGSDFANFFVEYVHGFVCIGESSVRDACVRLIESMVG